MRLLKIKIWVILSFGIFSLFAGNCFADNLVSFVTYFPQPDGSFDRILFKPQSSVDMTCEIGTLYSNETDSGKLYLCADNGTGNGVWTNLGEIWAVNSSNIYLMPANGVNEVKVGIGTTTPEFRLSLDHDGGILAQGELGSGLTIDAAERGLRFLWYPKKAAVFAGDITTDSINLGPVYSNSIYPATAKGNVTWGDDIIYNYATVAGGKNNVAPGLLAFVGGGEGNMAGSAIVPQSLFQPHYGSAFTVIGGQNNSAMWRFNDTSNYGNDGGVVLGGKNNKADARAAIALGGYNNWANQTRDNSGNITVIGVKGVVIGGYNNNSSGGIIGGRDNTISGTVYSPLIGGRQNSFSGGGTLLAGYNNISLTNNAGAFGTVLGGYQNQSKETTMIVGGLNNLAGGGYGSVLIGGESNQITFTAPPAVGGPITTNSVIPGGKNNYIDARKTAVINSLDSFILGGSDNKISNQFSITGGRNINMTGARSFAWGYDAANPINVAANDVFAIMRQNVGIGELAPDKELVVNGNVQIDNGNLILHNIGDVGGGSSNLRVDPINKTLGRDISEIFIASEEIASGELVVITQEGEKVALSQKPYDPHVVGIASVSPAIILKGHEMQMSTGGYHFSKGLEVPLALKGRVLCRVSSENGDIHPGDLLTSSSTPGVAMRATDQRRALGAIVGKALETFAPGPGDKSLGQILVIVTR